MSANVLVYLNTNRAFPCPRLRHRVSLDFYVSVQHLSKDGFPLIVVLLFKSEARPSQSNYWFGDGEKGVPLLLGGIALRGDEAVLTVKAQRSSLLAYLHLGVFRSTYRFIHGRIFHLLLFVDPIERGEVLRIVRLRRAVEAEIRALHDCGIFIDLVHIFLNVERQNQL